MQDLIIPVNNEAISRAMIAVVGEELTATITKAYTAIDKAMAFGFEKGAAETRKNIVDMAAEEGKHFEAGYIAGRAEGYTAGYLAAEEAYRSQDNADSAQNQQDAYDDGYIDGVSDARVSPADADRIVAGLCSDDVYEASPYDYDDGEYTYVDDVDSGDEQPIALDRF